MKKLLKMTLLALALTPAIALAQQQFSSPEQAASALAEAIGRHDESALNGLLGDCPVCAIARKQIDKGSER